MKAIPGARPPKVQQLARAQDRLSFVYLERCTVSRDSNAVTATNERGTLHLPAANLGVLLLGPGTRVTHQAITLLAESGSTAVWVGENGVRYYAHGSSLARSTRLLEAQAAAVSHKVKRLAVARRMYEMRFPDEAVGHMTMQQLRGREGARVRQVYRDAAQQTGIEWKRRDYVPDAFNEADTINQALSAAHSSLYGVVHAVIVALGCAPGLGFVHTGHYRSFVYDIADLYKAEVTIPLAFRVAASGSEDIGGDVRRRVRDEIFDLKVLQRCVADIRTLLDPDDPEFDLSVDVIKLWDEASAAVDGGVAYELDW